MTDKELVSYYVESGEFTLFVQMFKREDGSMYRRSTCINNYYIDEPVSEFTTYPEVSDETV